MRFMATYDFMETVRTTNQWWGATAQAMASYPATSMLPNPAFQWMAAWGEVTERTFHRMITRPDWHLESLVTDDGNEHEVVIEKELEGPFCDLLKFDVIGRRKPDLKVMLIAPMSGHYATLLRATVASLLPDCEVYITDWHNARDIPVSEGSFDIEDYTQHLIDYICHLGPDTHVVAVCQPVPLALAATAWLAEHQPKDQPATLTLMGGPVDPAAAPTDVTDFGNHATMGALKETMIQQVGFKYTGVGRKVYPGLLQLAAFMAMNAETHGKAFTDQIMRVAQGEAHEDDRHNKFYDEYLAVMDMPAEFYLSTVDRIFKKREIAQNIFQLCGTAVNLSKITDVAVNIIEGERDDISAPGQCSAALGLLDGLSDDKKGLHVEPGAGHYGIFAGRGWRNNIRPCVLNFMRKHAS